MQGTLIHIGAGRGKRLVEAADALRVVLIEAHPLRARALDILAAGDPRISVHPVAVAGTEGIADLRLYNLSAHDGIMPPTGLLELFPGLREIGRHEVAAVPLASLLVSLGPLPAPVNVILDAPGIEGAAIRDLLGADILPDLHRIELHASAESLHEGAPALPAIEASLNAAGFRVKKRNQDDPDRPILHLERDAAATAIGELADLKARSQADLAELRDQRDALLAQIADLRAELADRPTAQDLDALRDNLAERASERDKLLAQAASARQEQGLAVRLQVMAQTDLKELQSRYAELLRINREQEGLLRKLTPRLQQALLHLQSLPTQQQELLAKPKKAKKLAKSKDK